MTKTATIIGAAEYWGRQVRVAGDDVAREAAALYFDDALDILYGYAAEGDEMAADFLDIDARAIRDENEEALALLAAYDVDIAREAA